MHLSLPLFRRSFGRVAGGPINVCFVIDSLSRAGTESQLLALIRRLDRRRVRPTLCLLHPETPDAARLRPDCPTIGLGLRRLASLHSLRAAGRLAAFWRRHRVDVVQTYFLDSNYFAAPLARLCGIQHVVRVRNNVGYWLTPLHRWLGQLVGGLGTTLTNSDEARRTIRELEGLPEERLEVIENGVDLERFRSVGRTVPVDGKIRIGTVANLRPVKNIDGLVRVAAAICHEHVNVEFHVAGEGAQRAALERQIVAAGLAGRFFLHGMVADVPEFLAELDVAVLCSHSESMSNAVLEFMAAGKPIVATDVGANSRMIRDGVDGLIVPARSDEAIVSGLLRVLSDFETARRYGSSARERVSSEFSRERMVRQFEDFYESLVKRSGPR